MVVCVELESPGPAAVFQPASWAFWARGSVVARGEWAMGCGKEVWWDVLEPVPC